MLTSRRSTAWTASGVFIAALLASIAPNGARAEAWDLAVLDEEQLSTVRERLQPHGSWIPRTHLAEFGEDEAGERYGRVISTHLPPLGLTPPAGEAYHLYVYAVQIHRADAPGARCIDELTIGSSAFAPFDFDGDGDLEWAAAPAEGVSADPYWDSFYPAVPPSSVEAEHGQVTVRFDSRPICPETDDSGQPITGMVAFAARRSRLMSGGTVRHEEGATREPVSLLVPQPPSPVDEPECIVGGAPLAVPGVTRFTPICQCVRDDHLRENRCRFWLPEMEIVRRVPWIVPPSGELEVRWELMPYGHGFQGLKLDEALPKGMMDAQGQAQSYSIQIGPTEAGDVFTGSQALMIGDLPAGVYTTRVALEREGDVVELGSTYRVGDEKPLDGDAPPTEGDASGAEGADGSDHDATKPPESGWTSWLILGGAAALLILLRLFLARARSRRRP
jgi:hypothetical protein